MDRRQFIGATTASLLASASQSLSATNALFESDDTVPLVAGRSFIIDGQGFGTKPTAGPAIFDNFEHGELGTRIVTPTIGPRAHVNYRHQPRAAVYDAERVFSGTRCWKQSWLQQSSRCVPDSYLDTLSLNGFYSSYRINPARSVVAGDKKLRANTWHRVETYASARRKSSESLLPFSMYEKKEPLTVWLDEIYVDSTRQRVEIGDHSEWFACRERSPQPAAWWGDAQIGVTLNKGSQRAGATAYGFVVEADGSVRALGRLGTWA